MSYPYSEYRPNRMICLDANKQRVLPDCFTAEALSSRTDLEVACDDMALWVLVFSTNGSYAHSPGVGTTEEIEARHTSDSPCDIHFRIQVENLRNFMTEGLDLT